MGTWGVFVAFASGYWLGVFVHTLITLLVVREGLGDAEAIDGSHGGDAGAG